jgi:alpha-tubulin suppressor-like RCC1 family protein
LYHSVAIDTDNQVYTWGRGLYGVLGNGTNEYSLTPMLNEVMEAVKEETEPHGKI